MMDMFDAKGIEPMLIAQQVEPYDDPDSVFELKIDGIRCIAYCDQDGADIRNKRDMKLLPRFPELGEIYKSCRCKCILDGELNVLTDGRPDFFEVQRRTMLSDPFKIKLAYAKKPANFVVYDILYYKDHAVTDLPLMERKKLLSETIREGHGVSVSRYIEGSGKALFALAMEQKLEGVVGKKKGSLYHLGKRTKEWNKIKVMADYEAIAIAYIPKANHMTSLVLAKFDESNQLVITSHVTLGVSLRRLEQEGMRVSACPFSRIPKGYESAVWIAPFVCTVEYMPSDKPGLRQPVYKGVRSDKSPEECRIHISKETLRETLNQCFPKSEQ